MPSLELNDTITCSIKNNYSSSLTIKEIYNDKFQCLSPHLIEDVYFHLSYDKLDH